MLNENISNFVSAYPYSPILDEDKLNLILAAVTKALYKVKGEDQVVDGELDMLLEATANSYRNNIEIATKLHEELIKYLVAENGSVYVERLRNVEIFEDESINEMFQHSNPCLDEIELSEFVLEAQELYRLSVGGSK